MTANSSLINDASLRFTFLRRRGLHAHDRRLAVALASAVIILLAALVVRSRGLWAPDELRYAQVVQGMNGVSDLFALHLWGSVYTEKPPLYFWLVRTVAPFTGGVELATLLVPVVVAACLLLWLTSELAARWYGVRTGILTVVVLLTLPLFLLLSLIGRMDMLLALFVTAAVAAFYRGFVEDCRRSRVTAFVWMGLGLLAKGPFGIVFPLLITVTALALSRRTRQLWCRESLLGVGLLLGLSACWLVPSVYIAGMGYMHELIDRQVMQRTLAGVSHGEPSYFYFWVLPIVLLPWVVFLWPPLHNSWRQWRERCDPRAVWLLCWVVVPLVVLSLVREKLPVYLLPVMPPIAILIGRHWDETFARGAYLLGMRFGVGVLVSLASALALVSVVCALLIAYTPTVAGVVRIGERLSISKDHEIACALLQPTTLCFGGGWLMLLAIAGWASVRTAGHNNRTWTFATLSCVAPCGILWMAIEVMPTLDATQSWRAVADALSAAQDSGEPVVAYRLRPYAAYYLHDEVAWFKNHNSLGGFVQRNGSAWCAAHEDKLNEIEQSCVVEHSLMRQYPSPSGQILLLHVRPLEIAEPHDSLQEHRS